MSYAELHCPGNLTSMKLYETAKNAKTAKGRRLVFLRVEISLPVFAILAPFAVKTIWPH